jgi:hypothetical protein
VIFDDANDFETVSDFVFNLYAVFLHNRSCTN